jgi:superfamily II DNA/RNA helicase
MCRELAFQISEQVNALGRTSGVKCVIIVGGMDQHTQALALRRRPHVVVATPGRLADMLKHAEDLRESVRKCGLLVLDEADRMLEKTFEKPLKLILEVCYRGRLVVLLCMGRGSAQQGCASRPSANSVSR